MRVFALSLVAKIRTADGWSVQSKAAGVWVAEEWAAEIRGLEIALEEFPVSAGWTDHQIASCEIPDAAIRAARG
jgi:hypothetical protein